MTRPHQQPAAASSICALLACYNRRDITLQCLRALDASARRAGVALRAVLVDDGSTDGTAEAVREAFAWVQVLQAEGGLYWCRAMHRAWEQARVTATDGGYFLWLNDDTVLTPEALSVLLDAISRIDSTAGRVVVGAVGDGQSPSYGGRVRCSHWRRTAWRLLAPQAHAQRLDTMDGNLVLIDQTAARRVGNLDPAFEHAMGDYDWGLRARALGIDLWLAPGELGHCSLNRFEGSFADPTLPLAERWRRMASPKGLPWRSWSRFTRRHAGWAWPLYFAWPYVRVTLGLRPRA